MIVKIRTLLTVVVLSCLCTLAQAQPGDPGPDPGGPNGPTVPIDGGLTLLIAAGIGLAAKKGYDKRKKENPLDQ